MPAVTFNILVVLSLLNVLLHELVQLHKTLAFGVYKGKNQEIRASHLIIRLNFNKMNRKPD